MNGMISNASILEQYLRDSLSTVAGVAEIRGKGCLLGIEFQDKCAPVQSRLLEKKIITGTSSDPKVLRLLPPLSTRIEEIELLINELRTN
jgi:acetylornithine/succinyldiaminopimelate/putrescine aminotransferase